MVTPGCYKASVNESETITEAQPFCWVRDRGETGAFAASGYRGGSRLHIERS
jgi:hypothetical protein